LDAGRVGFVNPDPKLPAGVRKFGTNTADLEAIADWLKVCGVTTVAMESTGVYWILGGVAERADARPPDPVGVAAEAPCASSRSSTSGS
jgi:hypothetical protein